MSSTTKRKATSTADSIDVHHKRQRPNNRTADVNTGLHHALPGLDDSDVDLGDELSMEAIQYLRGVRSEAAAIPDLLIAAKPKVRQASRKAKAPGPYGRQLLRYEDDEYDADAFAEDPADDADADDNFSSVYDEDAFSAPGGYYDDGAYIAAPPIGPQRPPADVDIKASDGNKQVDADIAFHAALLARFTTHRLAMRQQASTSPRPLGSLSSWQTGLLTKPPLPKQLANIDYDSTFAMLGIATDLVQRKQTSTVTEMKRLGSWVWSLLAKVEDLGTLSSEEVAMVRELGKSAVQVIKRRILGDVDGEEDNEAEIVVAEVHVSDLNHIAGAPLEAKQDDEVLDSRNATGDHVGALLTAKPAPEPRRNSSSGPEGDDDAVEDIEAAKARLLSKLNASKDNPDIVPAEPPADAAEEPIPIAATESEPDTEEERIKQQDALLDMIFTIVGEAFGQRDLLAARDTLWDGSST